MSDATVRATEKDRLLRLLVEGVVDYAIYLLDLDGRITTWNPGAQRIKGYAADEVLSQPFSIFFTEEDRRRGLPEHALEAARRHGRFEAEGWRLRKNGNRFWASAVLDAVHDEAGRLIGFAKITRDMTERHAAQQALMESERRFRLLMQGVTDYAIFMLDPQGLVTNWNAGAERIKGYLADEIVGEHFSRFYTNEDQAAEVPQRALAEAAAIGRFEALGWRLRKDGTRFWANVVIDAIRDESARLVGFAKITRDLTERRAAQLAAEEARMQLAQSQKLEALGQLTGGVAHDFNNILQVVSAGLALAEKLSAGEAKLSQVIAEMQNAAARGAGLTKQLLAFSRRAPLDAEIVDTTAAMQEAIQLCRRSLGSDTELEVQVTELVWPVLVDKSQFEVALLNLVLNARDAMPGGGRVQVDARNLNLSGATPGLVGPFVAVTVRDTGDGIPEEVLSRIFEPFFTTKPVGKGTGLGLSQVHGFAKQAGGDVTVVSEVGRGTEVTMLLPAASQAEGVRHSSIMSRRQGQLMAMPKELRVLVVDDDAAIGRLTSDMLGRAGHHALSTTDPATALQWLAKGEHFDLVVSDVLMPGRMNGIDFAKEIRHRWSDLPILLATGYVGDVGASTSEFVVLHKPFSSTELAHAINGLLHHRYAAT